MSPPKSPAVAESGHRTEVVCWRGAAFGLSILSPVSLAGSEASRRRGTMGSTTIELARPTELEREWRPHEATEVLDRRHRDGSLMLAIDSHPLIGYRIWAPRHGRHLVSPDGSRITSALPRVAPWRWQRLLFAQVLPLAATLRGVELFHASAVELNGRALAFFASSGTGKTSIAVQLVVQGASLLTDDVLALEPTASNVLAHAGAGLANVPVSEWESVPRPARERVGTVVGRSDKFHLAAKLAIGPAPLAGVYYLARGAQFRDLAIRASDPPDPLRLLSNCFIPYVSSRKRLTHQLDVCAETARLVPMFEVNVPATHPARDVAAAVLAHSETRL